MEEKIEFYKNDTVRVLEKQIEYLHSWKIENPKCNQQETALVITKLEEAKMWSLLMVKRV